MESTGDAAAGSRSSPSHQGRRRVLLLPLPFQGHLNPMFQLGELLCSQGFSITIIHTDFHAPDPTQHPNFRFVPMVISETLPEGGVEDDTVAFLLALNEVITEPLKETLRTLLEEEPIACIITDSIFFSAAEAAEGAGLPRVALRTGSAACFRVYQAFPMLWERGYLPIKNVPSEDPVVELPPFRVKDLPTMAMDSPHGAHYQLITQLVAKAKAATALVLNTFEELEPSDTAKIAEDLLQERHQPPFFPIGPLHKLSPGTHNSLLPQDPTCIHWLDWSRKSTGSVLYVSFGSTARMSREELLEVAWGLARSRQPFLWVLRQGSVEGSEQLPEEFMEETRERGRVVEWAPQQEVLRHPSVGGFWTHCGWNSTLESISEGVPMLCWPYFADQMVNARVVEHVWKVGIAMEKVLRREGIERAVRKLMVEEGGREMRERAREMKEKASLSTSEGGSSRRHLDRLVHFITSLR